MPNARYVPILAKFLQIAAMLSLCEGAPAAEPAPDAAADWILFNGKVITVDDRDSIAQALAIKDGRIQSVGSNGTVMSLAGRSTRRIDLHGLVATPGLIDAHAHFARGGVYLLYELDLSYPDVTGIRDIVRKVEAKAIELGEGRWIRGRGWDEGAWANRYPSMKLLSERVPDHPVYLASLHTFAGWGNRLAFERAGITANTPALRTGSRSARSSPSPSPRSSAPSIRW